MYCLSKYSKQNRNGIDQRLIKINDLALTISPIDFGIPHLGGLRLDVEQHGLYLDGASKCDGYKNKSEHQLGRALDFYAYVDGKASWDPHHLAIVAAAHLQAASLLQYRITWGGFWKNFQDSPHIQIAEETNDSIVQSIKLYWGKLIQGN